MKPRFTTNAQNILHINQWSHRHVWSRTVATFQSSRGASEWSDRQEKWVGEVSCSCLSVPTDRNIQGWGRENVRAVPRYLLVDIGLYSYERFALFCCGKLTLRLVQAFYMPPLHRIVCAYRPVSVILYCIVPPAWFVQLCTTLPTSVLMQYTSYLLTRVSTLVPRDPEY